MSDLELSIEARMLLGEAVVYALSLFSGELQALAGFEFLLLL